MVKVHKMQDFRTSEITMTASYEASTDAVNIEIHRSGKTSYISLAYEDWEALSFVIIDDMLASNPQTNNMEIN
jgi:hypothetical protein